MDKDKKPIKKPAKTTKKRAKKGPNQRLWQRSTILIILILVIGFGAVLARLAILTLVQGGELQERAVGQQLADTTLTAKRGTIFDANGNVLAESASVWQVVMAPINFKTDEQREAAARGLSEILGLEYENVLEKTKQKSYYSVVKRKIEVAERDKVLELMNRLSEDYNCGAVITLLDDYKRYYPHNELASCVIGFAGADEQGLEGIEVQYDDYLAGTPGRIVTAQDARGTDMPFAYEQNIAAKDGDNLFRNTSNTTPQVAPDAQVQQGMLEASNVNSVVEITKLIEVQRAYEGVSKMMDNTSELSRTAVDRLGKVN